MNGWMCGWMKYSWFTMLCYFQAYSRVIQLYMYIYIYFWFHIFFPYSLLKILSIIPCTIQ